MADIHPSAVVDPGAKLGTDVAIGPYCVVGPEVELGDGTVLKSHVNIDGWTRIGPGCTIWPFASVGTLTQDLKYDGGRPGVMIGEGTTLREYVTVNTATHDGDLTVVGDRCHIMAYSHVAHDCVVGDEVIMANAATLAGHVVVEDQAIIGGLSGVHQFVTIGRLSIIGGCSKVVKDVPPFLTADGNPMHVRGLNRIGLERKGVSASAVKALKDCYKRVFIRDLKMNEAIQQIRDEVAPDPVVDDFVKFLEKSERGITR